MPEKDNKRKSLRFAGRDIDSSDFVRYSQAGFNQYMLKNNLSEDQKQDAINSFNEILPGIVNGSYSVSDFGKIEGGINANYSYNSKGKRVFGGEKTFNPYQFVETYLNGIVGAMKDSTDKQGTGKKKWSINTLYDRLTGSIFGKYVPHNTSELSKSEQFLNWANQYDPYNQTAGKRSTENRAKFITNQLSEYRNDIVNGLYNLTDEDKEAELKRIDQMMGQGGLNPHSLGTLAPWLSHLLFTEDKYQTAEQQEAARVQAAQQDFINFGTNTNPGGIDYAATVLASYKSSPISTSSFNIPYTGEYKNKITEQKDLKSFYANIAACQQTNAFKKLDEKTQTRYLTTFQYNFYNKYVDSTGNGYVIDWDNGIVHVIKKNLSNNVITIKKEKLSDYFNLAPDNVKLDLANQYINYKVNGIQSAKSGGILKASDGQKFLYNGPDGDEDDKSSTTTPQSSTTPTTPPTPTPTTPAPIPDPKVEFDEYVLGGDNRISPLDGQAGDNKTAHTILNPYDKAITALELEKYRIAKTGNLQNYWTLAQLSPVLKWANRTEYKTYTPIDIERQMALNKAYFNQLGTQAATTTSDQGDAFARQLAASKALVQANNPLATQAQQMTNATIENSLKNENQNNYNQYDIAIGNNTAIVAAKNKQLLNKAEVTKRNADLNIKKLMAEQYGIAAGSEQAFNEDMYYAVENDPTVQAVKADYNAAKEAYLANRNDENARTAFRNAQDAYNEAVRQASEDYKRSHKSPLGIPFAPPITRYFAKGGKTLEAKKEFNDMLKQQSDYSYKKYRSAYDYYRKLMMQSK